MSLKNFSSDSRVFASTSFIIDISWKRLFFSGIPSLFIREKSRSILYERVQEIIKTLSSGAILHTVSANSIRSLLDLYLTAKNYPRGSEIIISAINIPDMAKIIESHHLVPIACDISLETLSVEKEKVQSLVSDKTVAILLAHLFGRQSDLQDILTLAKQNQIDVIEDCAQALFDAKDLEIFQTSIKLYSLGLIKNHTALGGGFAAISEPEIAEKMQSILESYPKDKNLSYLKKLGKSFILSLIFNLPLSLKILFILTRRFPKLEKKLIKSLRAFPKDLIVKIRRQPSTPLLAMMYGSLEIVAANDAFLSREKGDLLAQDLDPAFRKIGKKVLHNNYWLYPVLVDDRTLTIQKLKNSGIFTFSQSSLQVIGRSKPGQELTEARKFLNEVIHLPFHKNLTEDQIMELAKRCKVSMRPPTINKTQST